jgi:hypothetical protein
MYLNLYLIIYLFNVYKIYNHLYKILKINYKIFIKYLKMK